MSTTNYYLSDRQLASRFSVSRTTIWRWSKNGTFPAPIKLSPCCTRWRLSDVQDWEKSLTASVH